MIRSFRAELVKLCRRRVLAVVVAVTALYAIGASAVVLVAASPAASSGGGPGPTRGLTVESLTAAGGGSEVFTAAVAFAGVFVFVAFTGLMAAEFSRGTVRTSLVAQPRRLALLAGKMAALLAFAAVVLAGAEVLTWIAALILAPTQDIATGAWTSLASLGQAVGDYGVVLVWVSGYAVLGAVLGVIVRSVPLALALGIAWSGPIEHLVQDAWGPASRWFPGLLLEAFVVGGTPAVGATRAILTVALYGVVAGAAAATLFARRDITA